MLFKYEHGRNVSLKQRKLTCLFNFRWLLLVKTVMRVKLKYMTKFHQNMQFLSLTSWKCRDSTHGECFMCVYLVFRCMLYMCVSCIQVYALRVCILYSGVCFTCVYLVFRCMLYVCILYSGVGFMCVSCIHVNTLHVCILYSGVCSMMWHMFLGKKFQVTAQLMEKVRTIGLLSWSQLTPYCYGNPVCGSVYNWSSVHSRNIIERKSSKEWQNWFLANI